MMVGNAYIIRLILIWIATKLRFRSVTDETIWVTIAIYYMSIFNYGIVYLAAPWDSRDSNSTLLKAFFGGIYPEFNAFWFNDIGTMVISTMIFNAIYPVIEFVGYWFLRYFFRVLDQRSLWPNDPYKTHCKTL